VGLRSTAARTVARAQQDQGNRVAHPAPCARPGPEPRLTGGMAARKAPRMATVVSPQPTPGQLVAERVLLFDLEGRGGDKFIGRRQIEGTGRVFGGQAIAQALVAARRTVPDDRHTHSLHAYFLRSGSDELPIEFRVKRDLDGRSFSNR